MLASSSFFMIVPRIDSPSRTLPYEKAIGCAVRATVEINRTPGCAAWVQAYDTCVSKKKEKPRRDVTRGFSSGVFVTTPTYTIRSRNDVAPQQHAGIKEPRRGLPGLSLGLCRRWADRLSMEDRPVSKLAAAGLHRR